jgi:tRNA pseudouridine55 synthase
MHMDCIINLNKPKGITSQEATTRVKKIFRAKKAGHTGTLDPSATGILLVCLNRATRLAHYLSDLNKRYRAVMKLGETTDTQDADGKILKKTSRIEVDTTLMLNTLRDYEGEILQKPPMFSALKHKGKPLYTYAHRGIDIPRQERTVTVHRLELLNMDPPFVTVDVVCSKGTYVRTLCHDIGEKLGTGAHLFELQRSAIESFTLRESRSFEELHDLRDLVNEGIVENSTSGLYTMDSALPWLPEFIVTPSHIKAVLNGHPISINRGGDFPAYLKSAPAIRIKSPDGTLVAIGSFFSLKNIIKMDVVFGS